MTALQTAIETLKSYVALASVSDTSNREISDKIGERLESIGFQVEQSVYEDDRGIAKVNLVAKRDPMRLPGADSRGGLAYFCHTDVVPAVGWTGPGGDPFTAVVEGDRLFGRGSCDMKGSLAAMLTAATRFTAEQQVAPLWIVCTADEEVGFEGAKHLVRHSEAYREIVQAQPLAIIGEPTQLGVVHAHKGIMGFEITSRGRAAHSSSCDGINANESMVPMLQTLLELGRRSRAESRYHDPRFDPPTLSWNFGVSDGCTAVNITPAKSVAWVSLRPMPGVPGDDLVRVAEARAESLGLHFEFKEGGSPFWVEPDQPHIVELCRLAGDPNPRTVCYGTDGGEFSELNKRVVLGPGDIAQAHTTDEYLELDQLKAGIELYARAAQRWCGS